MCEPPNMCEKVSHIFHLFPRMCEAWCNMSETQSSKPCTGVICVRQITRAHVCILNDICHMTMTRKVSHILHLTHAHVCILNYRLIERNPHPRGGFLFTIFIHQEPCVRGPPSKNLVQIRRGGSSYTRFLMREHSK